MAIRKGTIYQSASFKIWYNNAVSHSAVVGEWNIGIYNQVMN